MKKVLFMLVIVGVFACTENTSNVNITITQIDTMSLSDSIGIDQIKQLDSLSEAGRL